MSSVHAVTKNIKFEARVASFYHMSDQARKELLKALADVFAEQGKKHDFLVWRVQMIGDKHD